MGPDQAAAQGRIVRVIIRSVLFNVLFYLNMIVLMCLLAPVYSHASSNVGPGGDTGIVYSRVSIAWASRSRST